MTRLDLIKLNQSLVKVMVENKLEITDIQYIPMVEEYNKMRKEHHKMAYIICYISEKYGLSERGIYKITGRLNKRIKL